MECDVAKLSIEQAMKSLFSGHPGSSDIPAIRTWGGDACANVHGQDKRKCEKDELCYYRQGEDGSKGMCREKWTSKGNPKLYANIA